MSAANPLDALLDGLREAREAGNDPQTRIATVTGGGTDQVFVRFDGETIASTRAYKRVATYYPVLADRVLMIRAGSTWIVGGKIGQGSDNQPGVNVPNMPQSAYYTRLQRIGNRVDFEATWQVTATIGAGVPFWLSLPYAVRAPSNDLPVVIGQWGAKRTGVAYTTGQLTIRDANTANFWVPSNTSIAHGSNPYAWAAPDPFWVSLSYFTTDA